MQRRNDVLVIGGGQAGLAMGYHLSRLGVDFAILDAGAEVGHVWRGRWDSLRLFTPARYSALPGLPFPADPDHHPGKEEVAGYLARYAATFHLPLRPGQRVRRLKVAGREGGFVVETDSVTYTADQVVVATGPFQHPRIPALAGEIGPEVLQVHSSRYRRPDDLPDGDVLVVGGGNSGVQIAAEVAASRPTTLALGSRLQRLPQRLFGRSLFWYLDRAGFMRVTVGSPLGRRMSTRELLIGHSPVDLAREHGVRLAARAVQAENGTVRFADGRSLRPSAVIWATGFRADYGWISAPVLDGRGLPVHRRGLTALPGLYFLGLPWQHTRGSALLGWVGRDAEFMAGRIVARQAARHVSGLPAVDHSVSSTP